jgi:hypothetical protein
MFFNTHYFSFILTITSINENYLIKINYKVDIGKEKTARMKFLSIY